MKKKISIGVLFMALFSLPLLTNAGPMTCYDSYDSPSIWVDDYFARICEGCTMYEGHDFGNESTCEPNPL